MSYEFSKLPSGVLSKLTVDQRRELGLYVPEETPRAGVAVDDEGELHNAILEECRLEGWLPFHGSMAHKTYRTTGEPDFVILVDGGKLLMVECKAKAKKPSKDQQAIIAWARKLGHQIHVVRSIEEFRTVANQYREIKS